MNFHLVVVHEFGAYKRGDKITSEGEVLRILDSSLAPNVVKIAGAPVEPPALPAGEV